MYGLDVEEKGRVVVGRGEVRSKVLSQQPPGRKPIHILMGRVHERETVPRRY